MKKLTLVLLTTLVLYATAIAQQATAASDGNGGVLVTTPDGKQVTLSAATLGQLQVQTQQSQNTGSVSITGPVTPMDVNVVPDNVLVNPVSATGTTSVTIPITEMETRIFQWSSRKVSWKDCKGKPHSRTKPGGSRTQVVGVKTTDKVFTGTVNVDLTPAVQASKEYTDRQVSALATQVNNQRQAATIAVPIQRQVAADTKPKGRSWWSRHWKKVVGVAAVGGGIAGVACATGAICGGDGFLNNLTH